MRACDSDFKLYGADTVLFDEPQTTAQEENGVELVDRALLQRILELDGPIPTFDLGHRKGCRLLGYQWDFHGHRPTELVLEVEYENGDATWERGYWKPVSKREFVPVQPVDGLAARYSELATGMSATLHLNGLNIGVIDPKAIVFEPVPGLCSKRWDDQDIGYLKSKDLKINLEAKATEINTEALSRALGLDHPGTPSLKPSPPMDRPMPPLQFGTYVHANPTIETFVNEQLEELSWKAFFGKPCVDYDKGNVVKPDPVADIVEMQKLFGSQHTHSCSDELARCMEAFDALPVERRRAILDANKPRVNRFFQVQPRHGTTKAYKDFLQYQDLVRKMAANTPFSLKSLIEAHDALFRDTILNKDKNPRLRAKGLIALTTDTPIYFPKTKSEDKPMLGYQTYTDGYGGEYRVYANGMHQLVNSPTDGVDYAKVRREQAAVMERAKAEAAEKARKEKAERDKAEAETKKRYEAAEQAANVARKRAQKAEVNNLFDSVGIRLISLLPEANRAFILKQLNAVHALAGDSLEAA